MGANDKHICCICHKEFTGWGNNPWPIVNDEDSVCCDDCNQLVIAERLKRYYQQIAKETHHE